MVKVEDFLFNNNQRITMKIGSGVTLKIDATLELGAVHSADMTDHKVEDGVDVTDHKRVKPTIVNLKGIITNLPTPENLLGTTVNLITSLIEQNPLKFFDDIAESPSQKALKQLRDALNNSEPITISDTPQGSFENMQIVGLKVPTTKELGGALEFTITLKELNKIAGASLADIVLSGIGKLLGDATSKIQIPGLGGLQQVGTSVMNGDVLDAGQQVINGFPQL